MNAVCDAKCQTASTFKWATVHNSRNSLVSQANTFAANASEHSKNAKGIRPQILINNNEPLLMYRKIMAASHVTFSSVHPSALFVSNSIKFHRPSSGILLETKHILSHMHIYLLNTQDNVSSNRDCFLISKSDSWHDVTEKDLCLQYRTCVVYCGWVIRHNVSTSISQIMVS